MTKELTAIEFVAKAMWDRTELSVPIENRRPVCPPIHQALMREMAEAAIEAHKAHLSASGCVIVPREPTEAMMDAGMTAGYDSSHPILPTWYAMLNAADREG
jgi:hypothetical protein